MGQRTRNDDALLGGRFSHKSGVLRLIKKKCLNIIRNKIDDGLVMLLCNRHIHSKRYCYYYDDDGDYLTQPLVTGFVPSLRSRYCE